MNVDIELNFELNSLVFIYLYLPVSFEILYALTPFIRPPCALVNFLPEDPLPPPPPQTHTHPFFKANG